MIRTSILLLFCLFSVTVIAQPNYVDGYYISENGDTTFGKIDKFNPTVLRVKDVGKIHFEKYSSYYFIDDNRKFVKGEVKHSSSANPKMLNLEVLYEGDVSMYSRKSRLYLHKEGDPIYFLSSRKNMISEDGKQYIKQVKGFAGTMIHFMKPCITEEDFYNTKSFTKTSAVRIAEKYYECSNENYTAYSNFKPFVEFSISPFVAYSTINRSMELDTRDFGLIEFDTESSINYGVNGLLKFPRFSNLVMLEFGFQSGTTLYDSQVETRGSFLVYQNTLTEEVKQTFLNLGVRYQMPYKLAPYVFLGADVAFMNSDGLSYAGTRNNSGVITEITPGMVDIEYSTSVGINAGGGLNLDLGTVNPFLEYRIRKHSNFGGDEGVEEKNASLSQQNISFGLRFNF